MGSDKRVARAGEISRYVGRAGGAKRIVRDFARARLVASPGELMKRNTPRRTKVANPTGNGSVGIGEKIP